MSAVAASSCTDLGRVIGSRPRAERGEPGGPRAVDSKAPAGAAVTGVICGALLRVLALLVYVWSTRGPPPVGRASGSSTLPSEGCMRCQTAGKAHVNHPLPWHRRARREQHHP